LQVALDSEISRAILSMEKYCNNGDKNHEQFSPSYAIILQRPPDLGQVITSSARMTTYSNMG
jgi:hypothetical protein